MEPKFNLLNLGLRINISVTMVLNHFKMDSQFILIETLQLLLTGGVGGVLIVGYAAKDLFVKETEALTTGPRFASDYDELMWLAERQKHRLSKGETRRFYQLRQGWSEMHSILATGKSAMYAGT